MMTPLDCTRHTARLIACGDATALEIRYDASALSEPRQRLLLARCLTAVRKAQMVIDDMLDIEVADALIRLEGAQTSVQPV